MCRLGILLKKAGKSRTLTVRPRVLSCFHRNSSKGPGYSVATAKSPKELSRVEIRARYSGRVK